MRPMRLFVLTGMCVILAADSVEALGPHEILVLANGRSPDSISIADTYAKLRDIPEQNIIRLNVAREGKGWPHTISPEEFTRQVWRPATRLVQQRGLEDQILVWIYSTDFPIRISTAPPISIQGITFLRNQLPDPDKVERGTYLSPLFAGPASAKSMPHYSQTFDMYAKWLRDEMPLPSMMLGYSGERGNSLDTIRNCLSRGAASDGSAPTGTIYFVQTQDVRSRCRQWQHAGAAADIRDLGVDVIVTEREPQGRQNVLGIQMGAADVRPERNSYLPGSMAEHLTSFSAIFHTDSQSKLTKWIEAGVTASCGAVAEPYAAWAKFPSAHFYYHHASGCSMIESFYQSIGCPLQILLVGEALASPWRPAMSVSLEGLESAEIREPVTIRPRVEGISFARFTYLLDGVRAAQGPTFTLEPSKLSHGEHLLRVVANGAGLVSVQAFHEERIVVVSSTP